MMRVISQIHAANMQAQAATGVTRQAREGIAALLDQIDRADAVVIGCGSGMSSAVGYDHYHWTGELAGALAAYRERYGFTSPFAGFYHCYGTPGEQWAYTAAYIMAMDGAPAGQPYLDLRALLGAKPHFVITTNVDMQVGKAFDAQAVFTFQGDLPICNAVSPATMRAMTPLRLRARWLRPRVSLPCPKRSLRDARTAAGE